MILIDFVSIFLVRNLMDLGSLISRSSQIPQPLRSQARNRLRCPCYTLRDADSRGGKLPKVDWRIGSIT